MSRIGRQPVVIPQGVTVAADRGEVYVKGPLGELRRAFRGPLEINVADGMVVVQPLGNARETKALWGTVVSHIRNMVAGVQKPYQKKLIVEGIGYRSEVKGTNLILTVGFSHQVMVEIPKGVTVSAEKNVITVLGVSKEQVGEFAAFVRAVKKPEPYKGKGIRYEGEVIRRKQGKKAVSTT